MTASPRDDLTAAVLASAPTADGPAAGGDPTLVAAIRAEIEAAGGRIPFARFMALALYHPERGYYLAADRRPGRGGDFLTAPEAHPFFGISLARQVAEGWDRLGRPDPFVVREYGAGVGGLAYDVLVGLADERPDVLPALRYRLVEPNRALVEQGLRAMAEVGFGAVVAAEAPEAVAAAPPIVGLALANEVADALPVHRLVWRHATGDPRDRSRKPAVAGEARKAVDRPGVGAGEATAGVLEAVASVGEARERWVVWDDGEFADEEGELSPEAAAFDPAGRLAAAGVRLGDGDRFEVGPAAAEWFAGVARGIERGYALVVDYGYDTAELYRDHRLAGTVRAHRAHAVTDDPFAAVGHADLTAHVDFGALRQAGQAAGLTFAGLTTQGAFLAGLGMGDLLVRLGRDPETTPEEYLAAQAATLRLIDPGGMGRFRVLMMAKDAPVEPPLRGFSVAPPPF